MSALAFTAGLSFAVAQVYYFGVLAPQGSAVTQQRWQPWVDGLNQRLTGDSVVLVALDLNQLSQQLKDNQLDLVLAPQSQFISTDTSGWRWLATLPTGQFANSNQPQQTAMSQIGSTIWVKISSDIHTLQDLSQQKIAAVNKKAFGGYLLGLHLLQQSGVVTQDSDFVFVGYPIDNTLIALQQDEVTAAITPLCLMEDMHAKGLIDKSQFRALAITDNNDSGCVASTKTFPNWTLAVTKKAPNNLVQLTHQYIFGNRQNSPLSNQPYWLPAASTQEVEQILMDLDIHPSQKPFDVQFKQWVKQHLWLLSIVVVILIVSIINYIWMSGVALRQRQKIVHQHQQLRDYDALISKSEKLLIVGEMSASITHEINQPLTAIHNYAEGALIRLNKASLDDKSAKFVFNNILTQVQRSSNIIQNIRYLNAPQKTIPQPIDLLAVIEQCLTMLENKLTNVHIYQKIDLVSLNLPNLLLDQIFINVLLNAQQQGATTIFFVSETVIKSQQHFIKLMVIDDAGGFQPSQIEQFNHQTHAYSQHLVSTKDNGMGIGLSICRRLCQSVGGEFTLDNVELKKFIKALNQSDDAIPLSLWQSNHSDNRNNFEKVVMPITLDTKKLGAKVSILLPLFEVI